MEEGPYPPATTTNILAVTEMNLKRRTMRVPDDASLERRQGPWILVSSEKTVAEVWNLRRS